MACVLAGGRRILFLVGAILFAASLAMGCDRLELRPRETGEPVTPTPTVTPTPQTAGDSSPTPVVEEEAEPVDAGAVLGATLVEGTLYLREELSNAVLYYEPFVDYRAVLKVSQSYTFAKDIIQKELGINELARVNIYVTFDEEFDRFLESSDFADTSFLAGFYSLVIHDDEVADAKVFLKAQAPGLVHNTAHELAHVATPWLPVWMSEGVADYIAARVSMVLDPQFEEQRVLKTQQTVRAASTLGTLLDLEGLENFDWAGEDNYETLTTVYAQTWHLVEYVARRYGPDGLRALVAEYSKDREQADDRFLLAVGASADKVWRGFTVDIVENLTLQEEVGLGLCGLVQLVNESASITRDWNRFLSSADLEDPNVRRELFLGFSQRWGALATETGGYTVAEEALPVRDLWLSYFQISVEAMEEFARGDIVMANGSLKDANLVYSKANSALGEAFSQRPWLAC